MLDNFYKLLNEKSSAKNYIYLFQKKCIFELINIYVVDECDDLSISSESSKNFYKKKLDDFFLKKQYYLDLYVMSCIYYLIKKKMYNKNLLSKLLDSHEMNNTSNLLKEYDIHEKDMHEKENENQPDCDLTVPEKVSYKINLMFNKMNFDIFNYWLEYSSVSNKKIKIHKKNKNEKYKEFLQYIITQTYFIKLFLYESITCNSICINTIENLCMIYFDLLEFRNIIFRQNFFTLSYYLNTYYYESKFISYFFSKNFNLMKYKKIQKKLSENTYYNQLKLHEPIGIVSFIYGKLFNDKYTLSKQYLPYLTTKYSESLMTKTLTKKTINKRSYSYLYNLGKYKKNNKVYYVALKILENYLNSNELNPNNIDAKICKKIFEKKNKIYKQTLYDKSNMIYEIINTFISQIIFIEPFLEFKNKLYYKFLLLDTFPVKVFHVQYENDFKNIFMYKKLKQILLSNSSNKEIQILEYYYYLINLLQYDYRICETFINEVCRFSNINPFNFDFSLNFILWHTSSYILLLYFHNNEYVFKVFIKKDNKFEYINDNQLELNTELNDIFSSLKVIFNTNEIVNLKKEISLICILFENFSIFKLFYEQLKNETIVFQNETTQIYLKKNSFDNLDQVIDDILLSENDKPFILQNFAKKWFI